jgi:glucokinase
VIWFGVSRGTEVNQGSVAGVDIGGTNIKVVLVDPTSGRLVGRQRLKTMAERGPEAVVQNLAVCLRELGRQAGARGLPISGAGVGCAGIIDSREGLVLTSPNLPGWVHFPLGPLLATYLQLPVAVGNDADCIGCGEYWLGAGRDLGDFLGIALGTGVGGCLIIGGKAWTGAGGSAGEVGHMTIEPGGERCLCGNRGCLETLASASWVVRRAREKLRQGSPSRLDAASGALDAETIYRAAMVGDRLAGELFAQVGTSLAIAIANVIHLLGVRGVVIGGGLAQAWDAFIGPLREELTARLTMAPVAEVRIARAELGDDAGSLGAAYLAMSELDLP